MQLAREPSRSCYSSAHKAHRHQDKRKSTIPDPVSRQSKHRYPAVMRFQLISLRKFHVPKAGKSKVNHLGAEFKSMAEARTQEILEAYDYFRKKYNIR
jgi:hypothetical protein